MKILPPEAIVRRAPAAAPAAPPPSSAASSPPPAGPSFAQVLGRLGQRIDTGERAMHEAASGRAAVHDPGALLALQAQVYRYVEAVDLATKLVERATGAVKTTLQGQ